MPFPVHDWQFWVTTLIVAVAAFFLLRRLIPGKLVPRRLRGVMGKGSGRSTTLTIEGKASAGRGTGATARRRDREG
jgi:hypothetical protein